MAAPDAAKALTAEVIADDDDAWLYGGTVMMQMTSYVTWEAGYGTSMQLIKKKNLFVFNTSQFY